MPLVDVLGREEEAVIVEPQRALDLAEIARDEVQPAIAVRRRGARIGRLRVDHVVTRQNR